MSMRYNILLGLLSISVALPLYARVSQEKDKITVTIDDFRDNLEKQIVPFSSTLTARSLLGKSLQPLCITVHNGSDIPVSFTLASISNASISPQKVEQIKHELQRACATHLIGGTIIPPVLCGFMMMYMEFLIALNERIRFFVTSSAVVLTGGLMSVLLTHLVAHQHRHAIAYQKRVIDTILLSQNSHLVIKPGSRARGIALVNSKNYWGECVVQIFDESGFQRINRFDIDLNNQPPVVKEGA